MIGEKLGKYTLLGAIGTGSMGTVYKAEDSATGSLVAVKLIRSKVLYDRERRERFLREIFPAMGIQHRGICPILEIGDDNDDFFVVMPFLEGSTLEHRMGQKALPWEHALDIAIGTAEGLAAAHAGGAIHRGLKPANVWILRDGSVLVTDCALARFTEISKDSGKAPKANFAETLIPMGALAYMSPEQIRGNAVDSRTDIFSLGVLLYEMLTGHHPFESRNSLSRMSAIVEANPVAVTSRAHVPAELDEVVSKALAKSPQDRYQSVTQLADSLRAIREKLPRPTSPALTAVKSIGFFPRKTVMLLLLLLSLALFGLLALIRK